MSNLGPYEGYYLRDIDFPQPVRVFGWRRWRWVFELAGGPLKPISVPPPIVDDMEPVPVVLTATWREDGTIAVDCYACDETIPGDVLAYVSIVAAWIQVKHEGGEIIVNGVDRHPILGMSRLTEQRIAYLTDLGY